MAGFPSWYTTSKAQDSHLVPWGTSPGLNLPWHVGATSKSWAQGLQCNENETPTNSVFIRKDYNMHPEKNIISSVTQVLLRHHCQVKQRDKKTVQLLRIVYRKYNIIKEIQILVKINIPASFFSCSAMSLRNCVAFKDSFKTTSSSFSRENFSSDCSNNRRLQIHSILIWMHWFPTASGWFWTILY